MKFLSGFCSGVVPKPFLLISHLVGLLLSLFLLNLRPIRETLEWGFAWSLSCLVLGPLCLEFLGHQVRDRYNLFLVILDSYRTYSSMLRVGVTLFLMEVSMNVA